jgi:hypothetical protein
VKVYVVWDPLYEEVISVHKTEEGAWARVEERNKKDKYGNDIWKGRPLHEYEDFELEE